MALGRPRVLRGKHLEAAHAVIHRGGSVAEAARAGGCSPGAVRTALGIQCTPVRPLAVRAREMADAGWPPRAIARTLGVSTPRVYELLLPLT